MSYPKVPQTDSSISTESYDDQFVRIPIPRNVNGLPDIFTVPSGTGVLTRSAMTLNRDKAIKEGADENENKASALYIEIDSIEYICRICHGGDSLEDLLTPCRCKGSIALAHLQCLEHWLHESNRSECELCQYQFHVIKEPKYSIWKSVFVFLRHPDEHLREMIVDTITLAVYTPSTITTTYMLLLLCEVIIKYGASTKRTVVSHTMAFTAMMGVAIINFTYTSWLAMTLEKYFYYWQEWYKRNSTLKIILSSNKLIPVKRKKKTLTDSESALSQN